MTSVLCYDALNDFEKFIMTKQHRPHQNQIQVKVVAQTHDDALSRVWFVALAFIFAGVFYFWGYYYFWAYLWRVLTGG